VTDGDPFASRAAHEEHLEAEVAENGVTGRPLDLSVGIGILLIKLLNGLVGHCANIGALLVDLALRQGRRRAGLQAEGRPASRGSGRPSATPCKYGIAQPG